MHNKKKFGNNRIYFKKFFKLKITSTGIERKDIMDYDSLELLCKNSVTHLKKFNFEKNLKRYIRLLFKNIKVVEEIKLTGCKVSYASNWILDNFFSLENTFRCEVGNDFKKFKSIKFNNRFLPRAYLFCMYFIENQNGLFDRTEFLNKLNEYENNVKLDLSEIWSIPFFMKYVTLEKIYELTNKILYIENEKFEAHNLFLKISKLIDTDKFENILESLSKYFDDNLSLYSLEYFINLIEGNRIVHDPINKFLKGILENEELTHDGLRNLNTGNLNKLRIKMSTYIQWLRSISLFDWKSCLEEVSSVHKEFLKDPSMIYPKMDYDSRDFYRRRFEKICKRNNLNESVECRKILSMCENGVDDYSRHIGYYILDDGSKYFKANDALKAFKKTIYFLSLFAGGTALLYLSICYFDFVISNVYMNILIFGIFLILSFDISANLVNYFFSKNINFKFIPRMDYSDKIPDEAKTVVVISSILSSKEDIDRLFKRLEMSYVCNKKGNLYFSLILDYVDTISYEGSEDKILLNYAKSLLNDLNEKYMDSAMEVKFYLFVRDKVYSESNNVYMGWERKRGKIMEFIRFLKGEETNFKYNIEDYDLLKNTRYIIVIDLDNKLVKDSAIKLIGTIHHVLNRAVVKKYKNRNRIVRGYGIVQPGVKINFKSSINTFYSKVFGGRSDISFYNNIVSNVYWDIFDDSIFIGKGIIDIDVFDKILRNSVPEDKILGYDLIEGCFTKVLFASDIEIEENFPSSVLLSFSRLHRGVRSDWQLMYYLFRSRGLGTFSKYKIIDNLRKSLVPICYLISFLFPVAMSIRQRNIYYGFMLMSLILPAILNVSSLSVVQIFKRDVRYTINMFANKMIQIYIMFSFLPYQGYVCIHAIVKVLFRMIVTKKKLLEWKSFYEVNQGDNNSLLVYLGRMFPCLIFGLFGIGLGSYFKIYSMVLISSTFLVGPIIAYFISKRLVFRHTNLRHGDNIFLRAISRSIFAYFEDFVNESTNYLVCDNYQDYPYAGIAKKTSPTGIGMSLSAFILGRDFGFISIFDMVHILKKILCSIDALPVYRGHLYNLYDIEKAIPSGRRFISTVDSGNLLSSYYLSKKSLEDLLNTPIIHKDLVKSFEEMAYLSNNLNADHLYKDVIGYGYNCDKYQDYIRFLEMVIEVSNNNILEISGKNIDVYWHIKINESANSFLNEILDITCKVHELPNFKIDALGEILINTNIISLEGVIIDFIESYNNSSVKDENICLKASKILDNIVKLVKDIKFLIESISLKIDSMDFSFLYNENKGLLSIGYDCENDIIDSNCYDLLASESRIASFLSIAKGDIPVTHWFNLGRVGVSIKGTKTLLSREGSMSEYLMPMLYMKSYHDTLLYETYKGCFNSQLKFCNINKVPFGISDSCLYEFDNDLNYKYRYFGVPYVSIKKDCSSLVVSSYSSMMGFMVDFESSIRNLRSLEEMGGVGRYGFYEAIDFTRYKENKDEDYIIVKNYMTNHQGISFMALANTIMDNICQNRFGGIIEVESIDELLNESIDNLSIRDTIYNEFNIISPVSNDEFIPRVIKYRNDKLSDMQIYSNGECLLGISASGGGFLKFGERYISEASDDFTNERSYGCIYIKDLVSKKVFSNTYLPCKNDSIEYICEFNIDRAKFIANCDDIRVTSEIMISSDDNVEVRKILIKNLTSKSKSINVRSYFESESVNRDFEFSPNDLIGICRNTSKDIFMGHSIFYSDHNVREVSFENVKEKLIGINKELDDPIFLHEGFVYKNSKSTLENIFSIGCNVDIEPHGHTSLYFINSLGYTRDDVISLINKYKNLELLFNIHENNSYNFKSMINSLGISSSEVLFFNYITSKVLYGDHNNEFELTSDISVNDLISHNIDPKIPIIAIEVATNSDLDNLEVLIKLFLYFFNMGFNGFNLIILNGYLRYDKHFDRKIESLILKYGLKDKININNGIYIILSNLYKNTHGIVKSIANVFIKSSFGSVYEQMGFSLRYLNESEAEINLENWILEFSKPLDNVITNINLNNYLYEMSNEIFDFNDICRYPIPKKDLKFYNSYGGFSKDYSEYVVRINDFNIIPYSYKNILGNGHIFTCVLLNGFMSTWAFECGEFSITPRFNSDTSEYFGECVYLKEDDCVWSPTLNPVNNGEDYIVSTSCFSTKVKNSFNKIETDFECFVPEDKKYKVVKIKFKNLSNLTKNINVCYFAPILLTSMGDYSKKLKTSINNDFGYIYGENIFSKKFKNIKSYLKLFGCEDVSFTGSKREFLGINKGYCDPVGMHKSNLSNLTGVNIESCLCVSGKVVLDKDSTKEIYIVLGYDSSLESINSEIKLFSKKYFSEMYIDNNQDRLNKYNTIQIKTRDTYLDIFMNGWILHQNRNEKFLFSNSKVGELHSCVDIMEKCLVYNYTNPLESKKNIIKVFSNMYLDGKFKDTWSNLIKIYTINDSLYDGLWILFIFLDYIKVTGDKDIFNIEIKIMSDNDSEIRFSTIFEKCLCVLKRGINFDNIGNPKLSKDVNQIGTIFIFYRVISDFLSIFDEFGDSKSKDIFIKVREDILNVVPKYFNGEFYVCNLDSKSSSDIILINQALYIICMDDLVHKEKIINSVEKYLVDNEYGFVREFSKNNMIDRSEYCFQDNKSLILFIMALAKLKMNTRAYSYLEFLNPILRTVDRNCANVYRREPYLVASHIEFKENRLIKTFNKDFNYVSSVLYRVVMQYILGFNLHNDGFYIDPCVISDFGSYTFTYMRESSEYRIIVRKGENTGIKVNGTRHVKNFIKFGNNDKFIIDITT